MPTDGPFGATEPVSGSFIDIAIDAIVILLVANGLRRGRRWAWVVVPHPRDLQHRSIGALLAAGSSSCVSSAERTMRSRRRPELALATAVLWLLLLIYLIWVRGAFRARRKATLGASPRRRSTR